MITGRDYDVLPFEKNTTLHVLAAIEDTTIIEIQIIEAD